MRANARAARANRRTARRPVEEDDSGFRVTEILSFGLAGVAMVVGVALGGHYLGKHANAHTASSQPWSDVVSPAAAPASPITSIVAKRSLLAELPMVEPDVPVQRVSLGVKGDSLVDNTLIASISKPDQLQRLVTSPPVWKIEKSWRIGRAEKKKLLAKRRSRLRQHSCLSKAIYFEARGESELGQLAVAKVVLNRVKSKRYPNTICGVVYQNKHLWKKCQFTFACNGRSDEPKKGETWNTAKKVATRAIKGSSKVKVISAATHYHAHYVNPPWARSMKRLIKIGRHIFYEGV